MGERGVLVVVFDGVKAERGPVSLIRVSGCQLRKRMRSARGLPKSGKTLSAALSHHKLDAKSKNLNAVCCHYRPALAANMKPLFLILRLCLTTQAQRSSSLSLSETCSSPTALS